MEVKGYLFNFEVNGNHLAFENLSDGTRRVFMIAVEVSQFERSYQISMDYNAGLFLLEEPELGIHPHQLHKLMTFLKEQSEEKQIILTTHSPQVLDILNKDELDRIIIADFDPEKGSTFRHLDPKEEKKARFIMKEEPLSSYWRYSDLERSLSVK
jgi:predicted ATPase